MPLPIEVNHVLGRKSLTLAYRGVDDPVTIGRSRDCDVQIPSVTVGATHCMLFVHEGRWLLQESPDKIVTVNGAQIAGPVALQIGDVIGIGPGAKAPSIQIDPTAAAAGKTGPAVEATPPPVASSGKSPALAGAAGNRTVRPPKPTPIGGVTPPQLSSARPAPPPPDGEPELEPVSEEHSQTGSPPTSESWESEPDVVDSTGWGPSNEPADDLVQLSAIAGYASNSRTRSAKPARSYGLLVGLVLMIVVAGLAASLSGKGGAIGVLAGALLGLVGFVGLMLFLLPTLIANTRRLTKPNQNTVVLLQWLGLIAGVTWIIALILACVYSPAPSKSATIRIQNRRDGAWGTLMFMGMAMVTFGAVIGGALAWRANQLAANAVATPLPVAESTPPPVQPATQPLIIDDTPVGPGSGVFDVPIGKRKHHPIATAPSDAGVPAPSMPAPLPPPPPDPGATAAPVPTTEADDAADDDQDPDWLAVLTAHSSPDQANAIVKYDGYRQQDPGKHTAQLAQYEADALEQLWWQRVLALYNLRADLDKQMAAKQTDITDQPAGDFHNQLVAELADLRAKRNAADQKLTVDFAYTLPNPPDIDDRAFIAQLDAKRDSEKFTQWKKNTLAWIREHNGKPPWADE
jgi:hypothetical protein